MKSALRDSVAILVSAAVFLLALCHIFVLTPNEQTMGPVQRIFYIHVGSAMATYFCTALLCIAALLYLKTRRLSLDLIQEGAVSVGFLFASIVMLTGMIWGKVAWNTVFRFEPRLVSAFLLWCVYAAMFLVRTYGTPTKKPLHTAILGVFATVTVPAAMYSGRLLSQAEQLHPQVLRNQQGLTPEFAQTLQISIVATVLLAALFLWLRIRVAFLEAKQIGEGR